MGFTPKSMDEPDKQRTQRNSDATQASEKPTLQQSWDIIMKTVENLDQDLVKGYKEDIDTLLVFAGLFSAVVTAFTIESYQWLQEDPQDTTVVLLRQIAQQMGGQSTSASQPINFIPSSSAVRINTFWFLSLILALVDALFSLLCKQWIREHQRQINTRTPGQALALHWLRNQSFERWHVPTILASLPILLEIALFLFFAGLLELLWTQHLIPFAFALGIVGLAVSFYLVTTILPGLSVIQQVLQLHPFIPYHRNVFPDMIFSLPPIHFICPYKSPQSWFIFRLCFAVCRLPGCRQLLYSFAKFRPSKDGNIAVSHLDFMINKNITNLFNWQSHDLNVIQRFSRLRYCPDLYELKGLRWFFRETRDMPSAIPHLRNVLRQLPPHIVMPSIFDEWFLPVGKPKWTVSDIDTALEDDRDGDLDLFDLGDSVGDDDDLALFGDRSSAQSLALVSQVLSFHHYLAVYEDAWGPYDQEGDHLAKGARDLWDQILTARVLPGREGGNNLFYRPSFHLEAFLVRLLLVPSNSKRWRGKVMDYFTQQWDSLDDSSQVQLIGRLTMSIISFLESPDSGHDVGSTLLMSRYGCEFFTYVNDKLLGNKAALLGGPMDDWMELSNRIRHLNKLPPHQFKPMPGYFPIPCAELAELLEDNSLNPDVLGPVLDSYEQWWYNAEDSRKEGLIQTLSNHINQARLNTLNTEPLPPRHPTSLMMSQRGLRFLTFLNEKLVEDHAIRLVWKETTIGSWVDALERTQAFCGLPAGYFKPTSKSGLGIDLQTNNGEIVVGYPPKTDTDDISTVGTARGSRNLEALGNEDGLLSASDGGLDDQGAIELKSVPLPPGGPTE
ncbi:hypothetical protein E1B28_001861 [Marasmius oreades]|uniref:DUF6535 domain-containing protein n=1 Tax=Marasmius oreades TaxID=181124 RepID=A0A9P8AG06_9AGAR|nr:uncharacterized protein E1B28_001861 [Marasmius oreades]KAG7100078.1 hypothetical protein E1B28_001861 [Marasmius oreades]